MRRYYGKQKTQLRPLSDEQLKTRMSVGCPVCSGKIVEKDRYKFDPRNVDENGKYHGTYLCCENSYPTRRGKPHNFYLTKTTSGWKETALGQALPTIEQSNVLSIEKLLRRLSNEELVQLASSLERELDARSVMKSPISLDTDNTDEDYEIPF